MRIFAGLVMALGLGVVVTVACSGPGNTNDPCTAAGGACQKSNLTCSESLPYPCNASPNLVCCIPSNNPSPTGTADTGAGTEPDAGTMTAPADSGSSGG